MIVPANFREDNVTNFSLPIVLLNFFFFATGEMEFLNFRTFSRFSVERLIGNLLGLAKDFCATLVSSKYVVNFDSFLFYLVKMKMCKYACFYIENRLIFKFDYPGQKV